MTEVQKALLEAHVAHALSRWQGEGFAVLLEGRIRDIFEWMAGVDVAEIATPERVMGVIDRFVIELRVSGGITELSGEMARVVFASRASEGVRVGDVVFTESFEEFADKVLAFDRLRTELISLVTRSTALSEVTVRVLSQGLGELLQKRVASLRGSSATGLGAAFEQRVVPEVEQRVSALLTRHFDKHRERYAREAERHLVDILDAEFLRALLDDIWQGLARMPLGDAFSFMGEQDLEDVVVFIHEFWLRFRKTDYLRQLLSEAVSFFFSKYGQESVATLVEDMGVTPEMVIGELKTVIGPVLDHAARTGFLEGQIRSELAVFYGSPECAAVLAK